MPSRTLDETEFTEIKTALLRSAPSGLSEEEFHRWFAPRFEGAIAQAEHSPVPIRGSAIRRAIGSAASLLNPVSIVEGLYNATRHPIDTATNVLRSQGEQFSKAAEEARAGHSVEAAGHTVAGVVPLLGPAAAAAGEQGARGDIAGMVGSGLGLLGPVGGPSAVRASVNAARRVVPAAARTAATALETGAAERVAGVMSPQVGANKVRFGNQAERVAPAISKDLAREGAPWTREGLHGQVQTKLSEAEAALDSAADARNANQVIHTKPVIKDLRQKRAELTAQTHRIGSFKAGEDVVPAPNAERVAQIDQAIAEVEQLGPVANYEALRRTRQAYDIPAKAVYSPSMTADYLKSQGGKLGAADVAGVLRDSLAKMDPNTAAANAQYSLYRAANDVLEATREVERTRPRVGRLIANRIFTTVAGGQAAGPLGAAAGYVAAPLLDAGAVMGVTTKLKVAAMQQRLATAIRHGNIAQVNSLSNNLRALAREMATAGAAQVGRLTIPSESPMPTAPALGTP